MRQLTVSSSPQISRRLILAYLLSFKGVTGLGRGSTKGLIGAQSDLVSSIGHSLGDDLDTVGMTTLQIKVDGKPTFKVDEAKRILRSYCPVTLQIDDPDKQELSVSIVKTMDTTEIFNKHTDLNRASQTSSYKVPKGPIMQLYSDLIKSNALRDSKYKDKGCETVIKEFKKTASGTQLMVKAFFAGLDDPDTNENTMVTAFYRPMIQDLVAVGWFENMCQLESAPEVIGSITALVAGIATITQDWSSAGRRKPYAEVLEELNLNQACKIENTRLLIYGIKLILAITGTVSLTGALLRNFSYPAAMIRQLRSWWTLFWADESKIDPMALICLKKSAFISDVAVPIKIPATVEDYRDAVIVRLALSSLKHRGMLRRGDFAEYQPETNFAMIVHTSFSKPGELYYKRDNKATLDEMQEYYQKLTERRVLPWQQILVGIFGLTLLIINWYLPNNSGNNISPTENLLYTSSQVVKNAVQNVRVTGMIQAEEEANSTP